MSLTLKDTGNIKQPCQAEELAKRIRKERGLPEGSPVSLLYLCPCPRCSPKIT